MTTPAAPVVRVEHHPQPALGIDEARPRLSWSVAHAPAAYRQAAAEVAWRVTAPDGTGARRIFPSAVNTIEPSSGVKA